MSYDYRERIRGGAELNNYRQSLTLAEVNNINYVEGSFPALPSPLHTTLGEEVRS